jgi:predicted nucleic acid-binding protein
MSPERWFADTNLFLRYLTNDVPEQAEAFEQLLRATAQGEYTLVTNPLVLAEIVWTLESYYHLSPAETQLSVMAILNTPGLEVFDGDLVLQAIIWHVEKKVDFIDAYNAAWMLTQGLSTACTFDRRHFARFDGILVHSPGIEPLH